MIAGYAIEQSGCQSEIGSGFKTVTQILFFELRKVRPQSLIFQIHKPAMLILTGKRR